MHRCFLAFAATLLAWGSARADLGTRLSAKLGFVGVQKIPERSIRVQPLGSRASKTSA